MTLLNLTPEELLTTTRAVRKRLDFDRPVEMAVIRDCLEVALQAPTGGNRQGWHFVVVTDAEKRKAIADYYKKSWDLYVDSPSGVGTLFMDDPERAPQQVRVKDSAQYLADHMAQAPVFLIPCLEGRLTAETWQGSPGFWGSIIPAAWSFMLAARLRGLGTAWTTLHLRYEKEVAELLGMPYEKFSQAALIPVAYTQGTDFKPAKRLPLDSVLHVDGW